MPKAGDYSIVTDWDGNPRCVIQTKKVTVLPFKEITYELCKKEGEDDNLESWQRNHRAFFTAEGKEELHYEFTEDLMVVFEEFDVVYPAICYRNVTLEEVNRSLFLQFSRRQVVTDCWRKEDGVWKIQSNPFIDERSDKEYESLVEELKNIINAGGFVYAGFSDGALKGFVSVAPKLFGSRKEYIDLVHINISEEMRGFGMGTALFRQAADWAERHGAKKIYISAHSSVESQAFYMAMGCTEAVEIDEKHANAEPYDRQLEYVVK